MSSRVRISMTYRSRILDGGSKIWILFSRGKMISLLFFHSNIKFISSSHRVISPIYFLWYKRCLKKVSNHPPLDDLFVCQSLFWLMTSRAWFAVISMAFGVTLYHHNDSKTAVSRVVWLLIAWISVMVRTKGHLWKNTRFLIITKNINRFY